MGISVVIPAYNAAKTIRASIDSVLAQSEPATEIIVVDDGSSDDTVAIAESYPDVIVIRQENKGPGPARAIGTEMASSEYVAYLDADDWFLPDWLGQAQQIIEATDVHFLFADLKRGEPGSAPSTWGPRNSNNFTWFPVYSLNAEQVTTTQPVFRFTPEDGWELFLRGYPVYPTTVVLRRSSALSVGNWSGQFRRAEDFDMWLRMSKRYPCHYLDKVVAVLGLHDVNRDCSGYVLLQSQWDVKVLAVHLKYATPVDAIRLRKTLATRYCQLGWLLRQRGEFEACMLAYASAFKYGKRLHAALRWGVAWAYSLRRPAEQEMVTG